jgi:hypothetical protein
LAQVTRRRPRSNTQMGVDKSRSAASGGEPGEWTRLTGGGTVTARTE